MFSALRPGSQVYILDKANKLNMRVGTVLTTTSLNNFLPYLLNNTIDITVKVDDDSLDFKQLPSSLNIANYSNTNTVISDSKELMALEIEGLMRLSLQLLDNIPYHKSIILDGELLLKQLNPSYAKQKDLEEKILSLENKVLNMGDKLDSISEMLTKALNK